MALAFVFLVKRRQGWTGWKQWTSRRGRSLRARPAATASDEIIPDLFVSSKHLVVCRRSEVNW